MVIGVVGVGTIASAVVRGLCSLTSPSPSTKFVLSPRGAAKAAKLQEDFPDLVTIAKDNQAVLDAADDMVILAVLPKQAEEVLSSLSFKESHKVLSLIATVSLDRLKVATAPACECAVAMPLPAVAKQKGATLLIPNRAFAREIFEKLGSCVPVEDWGQFRRMQCVTALMGDFYRRQLAAQRWLAANEVGSEEAASWVGAVFATMAADSAKPGKETFEELVAEQTPGGLNEMVVRAQEEDLSYQSLMHSLDHVHGRLANGRVDPESAPAAKRLRGA